MYKNQILDEWSGVYYTELPPQNAGPLRLRTSIF